MGADALQELKKYNVWSFSIENIKMVIAAIIATILFLGAWYYLGNFYLFLDEAKKHLKERVSNDKELQIFKALEYMNKNDIYDIPTLAKLCSMSESRFYSNFKAVTGMTPIEKKHEKVKEETGRKDEDI